MADFDFSVETQLKPAKCCECGASLDGCSGPCHPQPGNFTICAYCACFNVFDTDMTLRKPTVDEVMLLAGDRDAQKIRRAAEMLVRKMRGERA